MIRRSLGAALWTLVGLLAGFLGALSSLVGTGAGRALLARVSEGALRQVFTGTVEIGDVRGSLLTGLTLSEVRLFDADTTLVAWLPQANLSYNPFDFAAGRVVLFEFDLRRPVINIVQHPNGRLNIEELLRLGGPDKGPHGPATLILFRNVRITDGTVTLRLQAKWPEPGDSSLEIATDDPNGRLRVRRFEHLDARLSALQVSSPCERGIRIDISRLAMESSDPGVQVVDAAGRLRVIGDSMDVQLARVRLPRSALRDARGTVRWPHGPLLFDLRLHADSATLDDFQFIDRRFAGLPGAGVVSGDVRLRSHGERVLEVGLDPLRLAYGGGTVGGRLIAFSAPDSGLVALRDLDLDAREFDLEFARPFLDTLPFAAAPRHRDGAHEASRPARRAGDARRSALARRRCARRRDIDARPAALWRAGHAGHGPRPRPRTLARPGGSPVTPELHDPGRFCGRQRGVAARDGAGDPRAFAARRRRHRLGGRARAVRRPAAVRGLLARRAAGSHHHGVGLVGMDSRDAGPAGARLRRRQSQRARPAHPLARGRCPGRAGRPRRRGRGNRAAGRLGARAPQARGLARLARSRRTRQRRAACVACVAGPCRPGSLHLATGSRPDVRARRDTGLDCPRRVRILRGVRRGSRDARLAHLAGTRAHRRGRRVSQVSES